MPGHSVKAQWETFESSEAGAARGSSSMEEAAEECWDSRAGQGGTSSLL